ncbi:MAG: DUF3224 domain-containing protein [Gammaproteobacteria bacterium]|nr:DUF3224 domain-containing protein [Gammaproteobacteria bacterium]
MKATGKFEVTLNPIEPHIQSSDATSFKRMSIEKKFLGDLEATSQGEMLSAMSATQGSAGYIAMEQVEGVLGGKKGRFVLQHFGIMSDGDRRLILEVVPDSGSDELTGISGKMSITIEEGLHFYNFEYSL